MKYLIILLLGLIVGAGAAVFLLGTPRAKSLPGTQVLAPEAAGDPPGTVIVSLTNGFAQKFLATIFQDLGAPSFHLAGVEPSTNLASTERIAFQQGCTNTITLAPEGSNIKTEVQFANGQITAYAWDFTDDGGHRVPDGDYRVYFQSGDFVSTSDVVVE